MKVGQKIIVKETQEKGEVISIVNANVVTINVPKRGSFKIDIEFIELERIPVPDTIDGSY